MKEHTADIFATCLDQVLARRRTAQQCGLEHPEAGPELEVLLYVAAEVKPPPLWARAPHSVRERIRERLLQEVQSTPPPAPQPHPPAWTRLLRPPARPALAVVQGLAALLVGAGALMGATAYAAQDSLPGDALYGVKRAVERGQYLLANPDSPTARLELAERRLEEMVQLAERGRTAHIPDLLADYQREVSQAVVLASARGTPDAQTAAAVLERLQGQEGVLAAARSRVQDETAVQYLRSASMTAQGGLLLTASLVVGDGPAAGDTMEPVLTSARILQRVAENQGPAGEWATNLRGDLSRFLTSLAAGDTDAARNAMSTYRQRLDACRQAGCMDHATYSILEAEAEAVRPDPAEPLSWTPPAPPRGEANPDSGPQRGSAPTEPEPEAQVFRWSDGPGRSGHPGGRDAAPPASAPPTASAPTVHQIPSVTSPGPNLTDLRPTFPAWEPPGNARDRDPGPPERGKDEDRGNGRGRGRGGR